MNMYSQTHETLQQCLASQNTSNFENTYQDHVEYFNTKIKPTFNYNQFKQRTGRATRPIQYTDDLISYIALYGLQHYQRMRWLLASLDLDQNMPSKTAMNFAIVDYGCGQGIASIAFIDHLMACERPVGHLDILLIEPSICAIEKAEAWIKSINDVYAEIRIDITLLNQGFDQLSSTFLNFNTNKYPYIHLFSNVLDIHYKNYFNLEKLGQKIVQQQGQHSFVAVSPHYFSAQSGFCTFDAVVAAEHLLNFEKTRIEVEGFNYYNNNFCIKESEMLTYAAYHEVI